jgi:hypothetical protein
MISIAARQAWEARSESKMAALERARTRRRVAAIDEMLEELERMHLDRNRVISRMIRLRVRRLEQVVGLPLPRRVVRARNTVRLHAALLDWQEEVLDVVVPVRAVRIDDGARTDLAG